MLTRTYSLFRYRFDSFDQVMRHLHVVGGTTLIYVPDAPSGQHFEGPVLLELTVRMEAAQTVVRGEVVARSGEGGWLRLCDAKLATCLAAGHGFAEKREGRVSAEQLMQFKSASGLQMIGKLLDVGAGGMRARGVPGMLLGETYSLRLLGAPNGLADWGRAEVVRLQEPEAGLRFLSPRSPEVPRYIQRQLEAWMHAPELDHPPGCCGRSGLFEPPLPKATAAAAGT